MIPDYWLTQLFFYAIPHNDFFNAVFLFFSAVGNYALIWFMLWSVLIVFEEVRHKEFIVFFVIGLLITFFAASYVIKPAFKRERPLYRMWSGEQVVQRVWEEYPQDKPIDYSFPSAHAATSFFAAVFLSAFHKKYRLYFYAIAGIISYSRIYLGVHYMGDVLVGAFIGWLVAHAAVSLLRVNNNVRTIKNITKKYGHIRSKAKKK